MIHFVGYTVFRLDRKWNDTKNTAPKKVGGLCMYVNKELNVRTGHLNHIERGSSDIELEISYVNRKNVIVLNLYRPPQGKVEIFLEKLEQAINSIDIVKNNLFIIGDLNIDFLEKSDVNTKKINMIFTQHRLVKLIAIPTRFGNKKIAALLK